MEKSFWQNRYLEGNTGWDLGQGAPVLAWAQEQGWLPEGTWLIPGAGRSHDALELHNQGKKVVSLDFALAGLKEAPAVISRVNGNFFSAPFADGYFSGIWEHTFFCAIQPGDRVPYVQSCARLLKPGGYLAGVFFNHGEEGGPPFNCPNDLIRATFSERFEELLLIPSPHSPEKRQGKELFGVFQLR